jgi:thiol-disulfide isomerase/thioredoxin
MFLKIFILLLFIGTVAHADEKLAVMKVQDEVYTNVFVTSVTATDVYFTHAKGIGNAKLKNLTPELQKHFHYNAAKGSQAEKAQVQANIEYRKELLAAKPVAIKIPQDEPEEPTPVEPAPLNLSPTTGRGADFVAPELHARSMRGQRAPECVLEKWLTKAPDPTDKFVLINFWTTSCQPCCASIPALNAFYAKYRDRLVVVGISDETEAVVQQMKSEINYSIAIDTQRRMESTLEITQIPHCILVDPCGMVRYEGMPQYLDDTKLEHLFVKYAK